jgi:hypothetical protein
MTRQETLTEVTSALLKADRNALFVERLLALEAGQWEDPGVLCAGLPEAARLDAVREGFDGDLMVTWLDYPLSSCGPDCCTILFCSWELDWNHLVFFDKREFLTERALIGVAIDLVEQDRNAIFLKRLFDLPAGQWEEVAALCSGLPDILARLGGIQERYEWGLWVTWLDYPDSPRGPGFAMVTFFSESLWNHMELVRRG